MFNEPGKTEKFLKRLSSLSGYSLAYSLISIMGPNAPIGSPIVKIISDIIDYLYGMRNLFVIIIIVMRKVRTVI